MNGSTVARLAYRKGEKFYNVGTLIYFRSHDVRIRLKTIPLWAIANQQWLLGTFTEQFKVEEPPYLEGDVVVKDKEGVIPIGRLITFQSDGTGEVTHYMVKLEALPADRLVKAMQYAEIEKKAVFLDVVLDDKEL